MGPAPDRLREHLVDALEVSQAAFGPAVRSALRRVPRHTFAPWLSPEDAYADRAHVIPGHETGAVATISQPAAVAVMLQGFQLRPGMRVLEIGAGTGYNAALMAALVGPQGQVVTLDLEPDLVEQARRNLAAGYANVRVLHRDGLRGAPEWAPFDRIVATVGLWDVPPGWLAQLIPGGRIAAPLHLGGPPESHVLVNLKQVGAGLEGSGLCGLDMVQMRGENAQAEFAGQVQAGPKWQGARSDRLSIRVVFQAEAALPHDHEVVIRRRSCQIILSDGGPDQAADEGMG